MSWPGCRTTKGLVAVAAGWFAGGGLAAGCAQPQGPMFEPVDPPIVWPRAPENPRIQWVGAIAGSQDLAAGKPAMEVFKAALRGPRPPIKFPGPHAVAVAGRHRLAIADSSGGSVHLIDLSDRAHVRVSGWGDERLGSPVGLAWVGDRLFVSDARRHEVIEFDAEGNYHRRFGGDTLVRPVGITYVSNRNWLCVVDGGAHCLKVFDLAGSLVKTIGRRGTAAGEFNFPSHIDSNGGNMLVADSGNFRVQLLDLDGLSVNVIGQKGDGAGDFSLPKGVAFDNDGHLYVVDAQFENVQILDAQGRLLMAFGQEGSGPGEFSLPSGLDIDEQDRIWVADSANRRICVFDYLRTGP
jgi:DNA-binding beta-propeller fold protein YncE